MSEEKSQSNYKIKLGSFSLLNFSTRPQRKHYDFRIIHFHAPFDRKFHMFMNSVFPGKYFVVLLIKSGKFDGTFENWFGFKFKS